VVTKRIAAVGKLAPTDREVSIGEAILSAFEQSIEGNIRLWFGIEPPNAPAKRLAAELEATIAAFEAHRGTLVFEDEPASFDAALLATKDVP
jgi:hypothetical protein